jgi:MazG family protein
MSLNDDEQHQLILERFRSLVALVERLRGPGGCPWDRVQTAGDLRTYILEEVYEVIDAIDREDAPALEEELGDLLFQVLFMASVGSDAGAFDLAGVMAAVERKMIRRHPHVFGDASADTPDQVVDRWNRIKAAERRSGARGDHGGGDGYLDGLPTTLPALYRTHKLASRSARIGFDWPDTWGVLEKLDEELEEFREALRAGDPVRQRHEIGDLLFTVANLSRHCKIDPERALMECNNRFRIRFHRMEALLAGEGTTLEQATPEQMEQMWTRVKSEDAEKNGDTFLRPEPRN